jgi:hypothetical protein
MTTGSQNRFPILRMLEDATPPSTPPTGEVHFYVDETSKTLHSVDDAALDIDYGVTSVTEITDLPTAETDTDLVLHPDGAGGVEWGSDATGGGGGGGVAGKKPIQDKGTGAGANASTRAITLGAAPTNGNLLLAVISIETGTQSVTSISQTNVTWTQLAETTDGSSPKVEIWKGVVAASAGTGITINYSGSTYNGAHVSEWNGLSGTLVDSASVVAGTLANQGGLFPSTPALLNTSANALVIGGSTTNNNNTYARGYGGAQFDDMLVTGSSIYTNYDFPGTRSCRFVSEIAAAGSTYSALIVSVT